MRTFTLLAILGAVALSASAVADPTAITPDAGSSVLVAVQTIPGQHHTLRATDVDAVTGVYHLTDGQTLRVSFEQRKLFAEVANKVANNKTEIVPAGHNTFVSRTGDMKLVFDQLPFANDVAISRK